MQPSAAASKGVGSLPRWLGEACSAGPRCQDLAWFAGFGKTAVSVKEVAKGKPHWEVDRDLCPCSLERKYAVRLAGAGDPRTVTCMPVPDSLTPHTVYWQVGAYIFEAFLV